MSEGNGADHDSEDGSLARGSREQPALTAEDVVISRAKREGAAARIRTIRETGQQRIAEHFRAHLEDHGEEREMSAEDFLRETDGLQPSDP